jgi:hypothetical protein
MTSSKTYKRSLQIFVWIAFIALSIQAVEYLYNYIFTQFLYPEKNNSYFELDVMNQAALPTNWIQTMYVIMAVLLLLKAYLFYKGTLLFQKLNWNKPLSEQLPKSLHQICVVLLIIGLLGSFATRTRCSIPGSLEFHLYGQ